jgi:acetoin utilization protein AcuB
MREIVQDWMTETVITTTSDATLQQADAMLDEKDVRRLAVVDDDGLLIGVLSLGDVRAAKATASADMTDFSEQARVGDLMTPDPITIPQSASLGLAAQTMLQLKVSGLPVVDEDGKLCGLLSESDLFSNIVKTTA